MSEPATPTRPFYVTGGTLKPGEPSYVERRADEELLESLLAGEFCYVLTARQMGKSSLMARTAARLEPARVRSAIVDLTQIGSERGAQASTQWYFGVANEIHRRLRIAVPLRPWWQERADLPSVQRLTGFFRELVLEHCPGRVVVFVDEIDSTLGLPFADDFFAALRACFNARATDPAFERLTFVLLGVATPDQLIRDPARTPFNIGRRIDLTDFQPDEARRLASGLHADPGEAGRRLERILHWTRGHPYLTQALCRAVRESDRIAEARTAEEAVDPIVEELFLASRAQREETNLKDTRVRLERPGPEGRRLLQLYRRIRQGKQVSDQPTSALFSQLKLAGVVKATNEGRLAVRNRIYEAVFTPEWAKAAMPADRGRQLAAATLAAALTCVLVWYAGFQPRPYEEAFRAAIKDDGWNGARDAYTALRANPFARSRAIELMQQFWEQRALHYALAGQRDESLLSYLQGLSFSDNERFRRQAQNLVGSDYERLRFTLRHEGSVNSLAFRPDGRILATASDDNTARLWDSRSGKPAATPLQHQNSVIAIAFSPDGRTLATASHHSTAWSRDMFSGKPHATNLRPQATGAFVVTSRDGRPLAAASEGNTVQLWNASSGKLLATPSRLQGYVFGVAFSPDSRSLATAFSDHTVRLWDSRSGRQLGLPMKHHEIVVAVAFSPDGRSLATASLDRTVRVWDGHSGRLLGPLLQHQETVLAMAFSPDGRSLATASDNNTARLWDAHSGKPFATLLQHQGFVDAVAFSPDGRSLATGSQDNSARLWDAHSGRPLGPPLQHQGFVDAVAFSPDGRFLATASDDNTARLWDAHSGKPFATPLQDQMYIGAVAFSPNGRLLATAYRGNTARLWDAHTRKPLAAPLQHEGSVGAVAFSPDGGILATASRDHTARLWNVRSGKLLTIPLQHQEAVTAVAFSPDSRTLATASEDYTARLWDAHSGKPLASPLQHKRSVIAVAFSPDGRTLATASKDYTARLWDAHSGKPLTSPLQHKRSIIAVAFSPDGRTLATASWDYTIQLWGVRSGKALGGRSLPERPSTIAFSPDGKAFLVATDHWLNTYSWDGKAIAPQSRQLFHGSWKQAFRFPSDCERCLQVALGDDGNSLHIETLHLDEPIDPPIAGDPRQLLEKWKARLGLTFGAQMKPIPR